MIWSESEKQYKKWKRQAQKEIVKGQSDKKIRLFSILQIIGILCVTGMYVYQLMIQRLTSGTQMTLSILIFMFTVFSLIFKSKRWMHAFLYIFVVFSSFATSYLYPEIAWFIFSYIIAGMCNLILPVRYWSKETVRLNYSIKKMYRTKQYPVGSDPSNVQR